ncbi:MAG: hypothetical protein COX70_00460 [Flavobacteriales bacterium CG_4_10_14_0_2_um_filter_32_8]|nr:MAG: hypothetical protein COX70_00460 [Flavobacteriales bacterium CG_4_10_14_0_2_um_filter_32_8]PJB15821.1 MAG: hypothetical protein CO118_02075 [Flavobacteriales bacterium CG_4_9_14_3_um_filter_32_8]
MNKIITSILLFFSIHLNAQIGNDNIGARSTAMGGFTTTLSDVWSTNNNQAGLGFITDFSGGIYYENRFLLKETSYKAGALVMPVKIGALGISVTSFGFELYNETKAGLSYGQRFGDKFSVGVQLNYLNTKLAQEYGTKTSITSAIGLIAKLSKELSLGVHLYNPTRSKLAEYDNERIPTIMKLGLEYRFSEKVMMGIETEKDMNFDAVVKAGLEYHITEALYLRGGISTNPTQYAFGFGMKLKDFKIDISSSFHQTLGITPSISIIYVKNKIKKADSPSI